MMSKNWKWQMEILRMSFYIMFPVGTFFLFNQPGYFEDYVVKMRQTYLPPDEEDRKGKLELREASKQRDLRILKEELAAAKR